MGVMELTVSRQDAWTADEDILLAEIVLSHIKEGSTQLTGFRRCRKESDKNSCCMWISLEFLC